MIETTSLKCLVCGVSELIPAVETIEQQGLIVRDCFICAECEAKIVKSNCADHEYNCYVDSLKEIWEACLAVKEGNMLEQ